MIKKLSRIKREIYHYNKNGEKVSGVHSEISGNVSGISGNVGGISGNVGGISGNVGEISGNVSEISGNVDLCEITDEARKNYEMLYKEIEKIITR